MAESVDCPECHAAVPTPGGVRLQFLTCPQCHSVFENPSGQQIQTERPAVSQRRHEDVPSSSLSTIRCGNCGRSNDPYAIVCSHCEAPLDQPKRSKDSAGRWQAALAVLGGIEMALIVLTTAAAVVLLGTWIPLAGAALAIIAFMAVFGVVTAVGNGGAIRSGDLYSLLVKGLAMFGAVVTVPLAILVFFFVVCVTAAIRNIR